MSSDMHKLYHLWLTKKSNHHFAKSVSGLKYQKHKFLCDQACQAFGICERKLCLYKHF